MITHLSAGQIRLVLLSFPRLVCVREDEGALFFPQINSTYTLRGVQNEKGGGGTEGNDKETGRIVGGSPTQVSCEWVRGGGGGKSATVRHWKRQQEQAGQEGVGLWVEVGGLPPSLATTLIKLHAVKQRLQTSRAHKSFTFQLKTRPLHNGKAYKQSQQPRNGPPHTSYRN